MLFRLPFKLTILLVALVAASVIWQRTTFMLMALTRIDPLPETYALVEEEQYAEAANYLGFFMPYDYVGDAPEAQALYQSIEDQRSDWRYQLNKLGEGLFKGSSDETIGQVASVTSDFFVIGDLRDLAYQGLNLAQGEEVDEFLVALATLGLVATSAQVISTMGASATAGAATPAVAGTTIAKSSLIALKTAKRVGKLPGWLKTSVMTAARQVRQTGNMGQLRNMLGDINSLAKTRGGLNMLSNTQNATELRRMARFADTFGSQSATLYRVGGKAAVDISQRTATLGKETILLAATFGKTGLRVLDRVGALTFTKLASRSTKMVYKGDLLALIAKLLLALPVWLLYGVIAFAAWLWAPRWLMSALKRQLWLRPQAE
ncbi:hypothetical protein [Halomonas hibernica]|uniref:hypothetical protein n=1 Tax=Halomonas hibernica TaxID=2591147 RepID=UPI001555CB06|nr:hypothetical protein [Halomonas hibernica]